MNHIHLIGIGGTGLSAIARVLLESGFKVSGSDRSPSPLSDALALDGVKIMHGHSPDNIRGADQVVRSSAISDDNPEVQAAIQAGIPVLKRSEFLQQLLKDKLSIAIAGTHGKTTTTAMIAWMLVKLDQDPSYIIGGVSKNLNRNAHAGKGPIFVIEADEYDHMFLGIKPKLLVVTNLEHDHPDCFPTPEQYYAAFLEFTGQLEDSGTILAAGDNPGSARLVADASKRGQMTLTYGLGQENDYQGRNLSVNTSGGFDLDVCYHESLLGKLQLQVAGEHNACNAISAAAIAHQLGLSLTEAFAALRSFRGTSRRFDVLGEADGITVIDDYAHHPTEIRATLAAARARYPDRRIWAVWQPHTYSRTRALEQGFIGSFDNADQVIVTVIYAARESQTGFSADQLVRSMKHPAARYAASLDEATGYLLNNLLPGDVLIVLSAGDADQISSNVLAAIQGRK
ncbi:MAG: UDP-N-acetylmuramate--L-alanine ligase [Anaerolineaceae bacterium]|nr:UDP-N-acetylmuramate--L-alanine ligase [Anaerolineaceae bacterium]